MKSPSELAPASRPAHPPEAAPGSPRTLPRRLRAGAVVAVVLATAFGAWLVLRGGDDGAAPAGPVSSRASAAQLRTLPEETGHPVYWAGTRAGHTYELTRPTDGNVYVRYLPPGVRVGAAQPDYLTIGTYPRPRALGGLRRVASRPDAVSFRVAGGGIAVYGRGRPRSVYLAFPGKNVQVEIYDPSPQRARRLARSGQVQPIE